MVLDCFSSVLVTFLMDLVKTVLTFLLSVYLLRHSFFPFALCSFLKKNKQTLHDLGESTWFHDAFPLFCISKMLLKAGKKCLKCPLSVSSSYFKTNLLWTASFSRLICGSFIWAKFLFITSTFKIFLYG